MCPFPFKPTEKNPSYELLLPRPRPLGFCGVSAASVARGLVTHTPVVSETQSHVLDAAKPLTVWRPTNPHPT